MTTDGRRVGPHGPPAWGTPPGEWSATSTPAGVEQSGEPDNKLARYAPTLTRSIRTALRHPAVLITRLALIVSSMGWLRHWYTAFWERIVLTVAVGAAMSWATDWLRKNVIRPAEREDEQTEQIVTRPPVDASGGAPAPRLGVRTGLGLAVRGLLGATLAVGFPWVAVLLWLDDPGGIPPQGDVIFLAIVASVLAGGCAIAISALRDLGRIRRVQRAVGERVCVRVLGYHPGDHPSWGCWVVHEEGSDARHALALLAENGRLLAGDALLVDGDLTHREEKVFVAVTGPLGTVWGRVVKLPGTS